MAFAKSVVWEKALGKQRKDFQKATPIVTNGVDDHEGCKALASVLAQVGDKWTILVVGVLSLDHSRFNALQRSVPGISHRMLTLTLRGLERDGVVKRTAFAEIPPRVEYELTALGSLPDEAACTVGRMGFRKPGHH